MRGLYSSSARRREGVAVSVLCTFKCLGVLAALGAVALALIVPSPACGQALGTSGSIQGVIEDPSHAVVEGALVKIQNPVTGYRRTATTDDSGKFEFNNVPFNPYHLTVTHAGFQPLVQDVVVRSGLPVRVTFTLRLASVATQVTVSTEAGDLLETTPMAHTDVDKALIATLPISSPSIGLSEVITQATPGVAADANGFFHPMGEHADTSISVDGQPINDQQS